MEVLSLQLLIRFSADPRKEFKDLCYLQKSVREDYVGYIDTLVSSYLVSDTKEAETQLYEDLSAQIMGTNCVDYLPGDLFFMANLLLYSLPGEVKTSRVALRNAQTIFTRLEAKYKALVAEVTRKVQGWDDFASHYEEFEPRRAEDPQLQPISGVGRNSIKHHVHKAKNHSHNKLSPYQVDHRPSIESLDRLGRYGKTSDSWDTSDSESYDPYMRRAAHEPKLVANPTKERKKDFTIYCGMEDSRLVNSHRGCQGKPRASPHAHWGKELDQQDEIKGNRTSEPEGSLPGQ
jgi:hypothetical protein